jgi:predicted component of type VI protein secretion system
LGHKLWLRDNQWAEIGRIAWADLVVEDDPELADVHFALQCKDKVCRIRDLSPLGGTFVNGDRVVFSELADGDEVRAGKSSFRVTIEDDNPQRDPVAPKRREPATANPALNGHATGASDREPLCVIVELQSGSRAGCFVWMRDNQTLQVGRSCFADLAVEADRRLDSLHFELVTDWTRCQLRRLSDKMQVTVNNRPVAAATSLRDGDLIRAGNSCFAVRVSGGDAADDAESFGTPPVSELTELSIRAFNTLLGEFSHSGRVVEYDHVDVLR